MASLRSLVAVLVTVVTLFGGAFRAQAMLRAQLAVQNAESDTREATLDARSNVVQRRAARLSAPDPRDGVGGPAVVSSLGVRVPSLDARAMAAPEPVITEPHRRVRRHVENMVFLI